MYNLDKNKTVKKYYIVYVISPLDKTMNNSIKVLVGKNPCKKPYQVYNRLLRLIKDVVIKKKRKSVHKTYLMNDNTFVNIYC